MLLLWVGFCYSRLPLDLAQQTDGKAPGCMMVNGKWGFKPMLQRSGVWETVLKDFSGWERSLCPVLGAEKAGDIVL